ncbi:MAG: cyclic nucleotide-binding domain-containing protein [Candidatus Hydrogenedens sp.]|nr:cyclic nucleotide-binding domain-containing protein [Candidatus Hydrogenedens sp.]
MESLPQALLTQGHVTREQIQIALEKQKETGDFLGEILVEEKFLDETSLLNFLAKYCKIPHLSLLDYLIDESLVSLIPKEVCLEHRIIPIDKMGRNLTVAMVNPLDTAALDTVRELCPGLRVKPILCAHRHFDIVADRLFSLSSGSPPRFMQSLGPEYAATVKGGTAAAAAAAGEGRRVQAKTVGSEGETPGDALLHSVFEAGKGGETGEESGPDASPAAEAVPEEEAVALRMTDAMMQSMRNTYGVLARRMELFRGLSPEDVARLFAKGRVEEHAAAAQIFSKGDPGDKMYVILNGNVLIVDNGRVLATLNRGDMFGEMALVSRTPRSADARAASDTTVLSLGLDDLCRTLPAEITSQILVNIIITLSMRLRRANAE